MIFYTLSEIRIVSTINEDAPSLTASNLLHYFLHLPALQVVPIDRRIRRQDQLHMHHVAIIRSITVALVRIGHNIETGIALLQTALKRVDIRMQGLVVAPTRM